MVIKKALLFALVLTLMVMIGGDAYALSCRRPDLTSASYDNVDVIFEGTVTQSQFDDKSITPSLFDSLYAEFNVSKVWKSGDDVPHKIYADSTWGPYFRTGQTYLVFANKREDGLYYAGACGDSGLLEDAQESLEILKSKNENKLNIKK